MNNTNANINFDGSVSIKKGLNPVVSKHGKLIAGVTKEKIYDAAGNVIATFSGWQSNNSNTNSKSSRSRVYKSEMGEFKLTGNTLHLNDDLYGSLINKPKKSNKKGPIIIVTVAIVIALFLGFYFLMPMMLTKPKDTTPVIEVVDNNGLWSAQEAISILDDTIYPGSNGSYNFVIKNKNSVNLTYSFAMIELYNGEVVDYFPLLFKLKTNDEYLSEDWKTATNLTFSDLTLKSGARQLFTLEWCWPFDSDPQLDTSLGINGGDYSLKITIMAEAN